MDRLTTLPPTPLFLFLQGFYYHYSLFKAKIFKFFTVLLDDMRFLLYKRRQLVRDRRLGIFPVNPAIDGKMKRSACFYAAHLTKTTLGFVFIFLLLLYVRNLYGANIRVRY